MVTQTQIEQIRQEPQAESEMQPLAQHWSLAGRIAFRFCFVYFSLGRLDSDDHGRRFTAPGYSLSPGRDFGR